MSEAQPELTRRSLKTPRAAAIADIVFAILYGASLALVRASRRVDCAFWLETSARTVSLALNLVPYAGIAFQWFIGVIRDHILGQRLAVSGLNYRSSSLGGWAFLTYTLALVLLASISFSQWVNLNFPGWVLAISAFFLIGKPAPTAKGGGGRERNPMILSAAAILR